MGVGVGVCAGVCVYMFVRSTEDYSIEVFTPSIQFTTSLALPCLPPASSPHYLRPTTGLAAGLVHYVRLSEMIFGEVYCIVPTLCGQ